MKKINQSRRDFLTKCALFSAAGYSSAFASIGAQSLIAAASSAANPPTEYRAMVNIFLAGGNDTNLLVPNDNTGYNLYNQVRTSVALGRNTLLPITSNTNGTVEQFGLHPSVTGMQTLYNEGNLGFIANSGALIEPTTAAEYLDRRNNNVRLPPNLFSHNSQQDFVRACLPFEGEKLTGWGGRIADMFKASGTTSPLNLSFNGDNVWQRGNNTLAYGLDRSGVRRLDYYRDDSNATRASRKDALAQMNQLANDHLLTQEYGRIVQNSLELSDNLREGAQIQEIELQTEFPNTRAGGLLNSVARLINARNGLQMPQQSFYLVLGGWDQHNNLLSSHTNTLGQLDGAMLAFYRALEEMGLQNQVTTFTNTDFGRTLTSNGDGSDHAWGGHQIIMGGAIDGGKVYGTYPRLTTADSQFVERRGALVPSTSMDQISATIAKWFGDFTDSQLLELFPNLANFNQRDLGFFV